jgi:hypothetical protein
MKKQAALGSAVALAAATGWLLAPPAAFALNFNFSFGGVSGIITGLSTGQNSCVDPFKCTVEVTSSGVGGVGTYRFTSSPDPSFPGGFVVSSGGDLISTNWVGFFDPQMELRLGSRGFGRLLSFDGDGIPRDEDSGFLTFTPVPPPAAAVPGPLPVVGAAAAFGFSRKLRKRIKGSSNAFSTAPFA